MARARFEIETCQFTQNHFDDAKLHQSQIDKVENGSYKGVSKREAVYKCTNKDYLPEAKQRANDHFTCSASPRR